MERGMRKKLQCASVAALTVAGLTMFGCAMYGGDTVADSQGALVQEVGEGESGVLMPVVTTDENGVSYQRTPLDTFADGNAASITPDKPNEFNTRFLDADNRGCASCHDDLGQTLVDMDYDHPNLGNNNYGIETTVQMCIDCHTTAHGYVDEDNNFGQLMHQIHGNERSATCWSCHVGTEDGNGMQLWDVVKYDWLRGITDVENVEGDFSFTQDSVVHRSENGNLVDFLETGWANMIEWGHAPGVPGKAGPEANDEVPLDQELFDNWTITITGNVEQDVTWTLPELIEQAPSEDLTLKMSCDWNPLGGPFISNCEVRGIPLSWLLEKAGAKDMYGFTSVPGSISEDGVMPQNYFEFVTKTDGNPDDEAYIVYQLDGTDLQWSEGYPVALWIGGYGSAGACTKQVSDIIVYDEAGFKEMNKVMSYGYTGWTTPEGDEGIVAGEQEQQGWFINKPCVGLFNNREGRIIDAGKPYTFEGYADSFDNEVTAIEFSMDGGQTWTSYATEGATDERWVNWKFTYTPEEEGAYVLMVRSKNVNGLVTPEPIEFMFNVESA